MPMHHWKKRPKNIKIMNYRLAILIFLLLITIISCATQQTKSIPQKPPFDTETAIGLFAQGQYFLKQKNYEEALDAFRTLVDDFEDDALADDAQFLIAEILSNPRYEDYDLEEALSEYENLIENYPQSPYLPKAKQKIKQIEKKLESEE